MTGEYDVVVVGAGILGCSAAYHIQRLHPHYRTLLLDRLPAAGQANTGRSAAMFRNVFSSKDNRTLAETSIDCYLHLQREMGVDLGIEQMGYLWLMSERQLKETGGQVDAMRRDGVGLRSYGAGELRTLMPGLATEFDPGSDESQLVGLEPIAAGIFAEKCGALQPEKLVQHYASGFVRMGGRVAYDTEATELVVEPDRKLGLDGEPFVWQDSRVVGVRTRGRAEAEVRARRIVLATGAWANELLEPRGFDSHVKAKKGQLFRVDAAGHPGLLSLLRTPGFSSTGSVPFLVLPRSAVYVKPVRSESSFWIGCDDEVNRPFMDLPPGMDGLSPEATHYEYNIRPVLKGYLPAFTDARPSSMWAGMFGINPVDHIPYVFEEHGAVVLVGDSGSGIMKGDALGRVAAAACDGEDEAELFGGVRYRVERLHYRSRRIEEEKWIL